MEDYKQVVENMIIKYNKQFTEIWKINPNVYFQPEATIPELWELLQQLHENIVVNKLITDWRSVEEWPESQEYYIVYSIVNLLFNGVDSFMPEGIIEYIMEQVFSKQGTKRKLLHNMYWRTWNSLKLLNNAIRDGRKEIKDMQNESFNTLTKDLYGTDDYIYLFSGVRDTVFPNNELMNFINIRRRKSFPLRSWTVDMRVAMHFAASSDSETRDVVDISDKPFRLIFITKVSKLCYVSPPHSWEAEVLIPSSNYSYAGHFEVDIPYYTPKKESTTGKDYYDEGSLPLKKFVFVIVDRIEDINFRNMNALEYNKYIDRIYDRFIGPLVDEEEMVKRKLPEEPDDFDFDEEDEEEVIDDYNRRRSGKVSKWTGEGGGRYTKKKKSKRSKPKRRKTKKNKSKRHKTKNNKFKRRKSKRKRKSKLR
jgi:hypothetical protein